MSSLRIEVQEWLGRVGDPIDATLAELRIVAGPDDIVLTRVNDSMALTLRDTIRVPAVLLAQWFAMHWWRLRWETRPNEPTSDWLRAHSIAGVSGGVAWPPLEISSDGEFIQLRQRPERGADVAAIQYLSEAATIEVPVADFETAVDLLFGQVQDRLSVISPGYRDFAEVRDELDIERRDPTTAQQCRWQPRAGFDAGDADETWIAAIEDGAKLTGARAMEEVLAVLRSRASAASLEGVVRTFQGAAASIDLESIPRVSIVDLNGRPPWIRGAIAAQRVRTALGISSGPVSNLDLDRLLQAKLPLRTSALALCNLAGAYRAPHDESRSQFLTRTQRPSSQRFALARIMGMASVGTDAERLLALSSETTAVQKFSRAFAQEFLLPWNELDAATNEDGTDSDTIETLAEHFGVSEMVVAMTLVNRGKLDRTELARFD